MPKSSRFSTGIRKLMKERAFRIQSQMRKLGYTAAQLSEECSLAAGELMEANQPSLSRDRIAKILMNCHPRPRNSAAIVLSHEEIVILSRSLKVSVEWLAVQTDNEEPIVWNVLTQPDRSTHVLHLLEEYEERAGENAVWCEYLLCSFVTEEFMLAFHRAHFGEMDTAGVTKDKRQLVDFFNRIGRARRKRVLRPDRAFVFTGLIFDSELNRIVTGEGIYGSIPRVVRRASLEHIATVLMDPSLKMNLVIVRDGEVPRAKAAWRDHETVGVMGELFSLWNYHSGSIGWSENPRYVRHQRDLIRELRRHAVCTTPQETTDYIKQLSASL